VLDPPPVRLAANRIELGATIVHAVATVEIARGPEEILRWVRIPAFGVFRHERAAIGLDRCEVGDRWMCPG
jgi:hypothetical protein